MSRDDEMINELKGIRKLLEPKPAPPATPPPKGMWNEFKAFLDQYKVLGMAIGVVIGLYMGNVIQALVKDLIMPVIGLAVPGMSDLASLKINVGNQVFGVGDFTVAVITFIIVAFVIFLIAKMATKASFNR